MNRGRLKTFFHYLGIYLIKMSRLLLPVATITFFIYFVLENFKTGLISNYFDLNFLLVLAIISGITVIIFDE